MILRAFFALVLSIMTVVMQGSAGLAYSTDSLETYDQSIELTLHNNLAYLIQDNTDEFDITFDIQANGEISDIKISGDGLNETFRQELKSTVKTMSPLPPLPAGCPTKITYSYTHNGSQMNDQSVSDYPATGTATLQAASTILWLCMFGFLFGPAQFLSFIAFTALIWNFSKLFKDERITAGS